MLDKYAERVRRADAGGGGASIIDALAILFTLLSFAFYWGLPVLIIYLLFF